MAVAVGLVALILVPRAERRLSDALWTFDHTVEDRPSFEVARAAGRIKEDPNRHRLRQGVLNAAARIAFSPCDAQLRPPFRVAVGALLVELRKTADQQVETAAIAGKLVDAAAFLNNGVVDVIQEAKNAGLLYREDLPSEVGMSFPPRPRKPARQSGRFACRTDGRTDDG